MDFEYCVVQCCCPDDVSAEKMAKKLLKERLVACVNIIPAIQSYYVWQGVAAVEGEVMLVMKTKKTKLPDLEKCTLSEHPYDCPEIIALPIVFGHSKYLEWLDESVLAKDKAS